MNYLIQNDTVVHKSEKRLRSFIGNYIESEEDWAIGSSYIDGVFGEPVKTFDEELSALNDDYQSKLTPLVAEASLAAARNIDNQSSKLVAARAKIADLDTWYATEQEALFIKYFS